eukprot:1996788-Rhodomonas_salina.1
MRSARSERRNLRIRGASQRQPRQECSCTTDHDGSKSVKRKETAMATSVQSNTERERETTIKHSASIDFPQSNTRTHTDHKQTEHSVHSKPGLEACRPGGGRGDEGRREDGEVAGSAEGEVAYDRLPFDADRGFQRLPSALFAS